MCFSLALILHLKVKDEGRAQPLARPSNFQGIGNNMAQRVQVAVA
jgi:hypothetical protein